MDEPLPALRRELLRIAYVRPSPDDDDTWYVAAGQDVKPLLAIQPGEPIPAWGPAATECGPLCKPDRHFIKAPPDRAGHIDCPNMCTKRVECGGSCCRDRDHAGECECIGDDPGQPGSCPA